MKLFLTMVLALIACLTRAENFWPSQNWPFKTWVQSEDAYIGALERAEARNPFLNGIDYGYHVGYPNLTYNRYTSTKNNLDSTFKAIVERHTYMGWYFDYPPSERGAYHTHKVAPVSGQWRWNPDLYTEGGWMTQAGLNHSWLIPRNFTQPDIGGGPDLPRFGLSYAVNGLRNMNAVSNLNYAFVDDKVTLTERGLPTDYNASSSTQEYHLYESVPITSNLHYEAESFPFMGVWHKDSYDGIMSYDDVPANSEPPDFWLDWAYFIAKYYEMPWYDGHGLDAEDINVSTQIPATLEEPVLLRLYPANDAWGVKSEPATTNTLPWQPWENGNFAVASVVNTSPKNIRSIGFQVDVLPIEHELKYRQYRLKWNAVPYADKYYVVAYNKNRGELPSDEQVMAWMFVDAPAIECVLTIPNDPMTAPDLITDFGGGPQAGLGALISWLPMGVTNLTYFNEKDSHLFDAVDYKLNYEHTAVAKFTTPPAGWWLERWEHPLTWTADTLAGPVTLASNQWYILWNRDLSYTEWLRVLEPKTLLFSKQPSIPKYTTALPSIDWWALVQPEYAFNTNDLVRLIKERATEDDYVEFWDKTDVELGGIRYFKDLPSEGGPWAPSFISDSKNWSKRSIDDACYFDLSKLVTNTLVTITNEVLVTQLVSEDGTDTEFGSVTNYILIPLSVATTNIIQPAGYSGTLVATELNDGDWPDTGNLAGYVVTIVDYLDEDGTPRSGMSQGFQGFGGITINTGKKLGLSWNAVAGATHYGVWIKEQAAPPAFDYYGVVDGTTLTLTYADSNGGPEPSGPYNVVSNHNWNATNIFVGNMTVTNRLLTLEAITNYVHHSWYQQELITRCEGDDVVTENAPIVEWSSSIKWTNEQYTAVFYTNYTTNIDVLVKWGVTYTNTTITRDVSGQSAKWRTSRWIPVNDQDLENLGGIKQESTPYVYADPERYDLYRWYQTNTFNITELYTQITTGVAYDVSVQSEYTLSYADGWTNNYSTNILSPILPYRVDDFEAQWSKKYPTYFLKE